MRITQHSAGYDNSIAYVDGKKFVDYVYADEERREVKLITGELLKGDVKIVLNAGSSRF